MARWAPLRLEVGPVRGRWEASDKRRKTQLVHGTQALRITRIISSWDESQSAVIDAFAEQRDCLSPSPQPPRGSPFPGLARAPTRGLAASPLPHTPPGSPFGPFPGLGPAFPARAPARGRRCACTLNTADRHCRPSPARSDSIGRCRRCAELRCDGVQRVLTA